VKVTLVRRFSLTERLVHWANAIPFLVCLATGTLMAFRGRFQIATDTESLIRNVHLVSACCLVALPLLVWLAGDASALFRWIWGALRWSLRDIVWLFYPLLKPFVWRLKIPTAERFNAGQKVNMILMAAIKVALAVSGLQMWLGRGSLLAHYVHLGCYFAALPLLGGHIFMAALNPRTCHSMRSMLSGWVREDWLRHHHGRWVARMGERLPRKVVEQPGIPERVRDERVEIVAPLIVEASEPPG
jgi:formate dehydrogenase subunit gamma